MKTQRLLMAALALLALAGCSTVDSRIREKSAIYAALPGPEQQAIRNGTVDLGFTPDMVYMALGRPDQIVTRETKEGKLIRWIYFAIDIEWAGKAVTHVDHYVVTDRKTGASFVVAQPVYENVYSQEVRERLRVEFRDGKVIAIEKEKQRP